MDPQHDANDTLKHLEKQNDLLTESHRAMTEELRKLMVEEQMLMEKFYELMTAHVLIKKKKEGQNVGEGKEVVVASSSPIVTCGDKQ
ncbi:PREDICTED: uncharacterized protein LOC104807627 [Tarenaya hassleriana]|uniref:uncharacterized protein LOC104807627 n=1 Tax=Tarenaya hassleriana TaxID=28532 RepID=UPI00053C4DFA|nr:PREDICTED: uncharacterized protein LOC104807627 [Tarenaya hassleriana]